MTIYFVSRHSGAKQWAEQQGLQVDKFVEHLSLDEVQAGDVIIGSLPVNLACEVCAKGAKYQHLSLEIPREWRGQELSAQQLTEIGARIEEYHIERRAPLPESKPPAKAEGATLFAFLGIGKYEECLHVFPNDEADSVTTKFASVAIAKWLGAENLVIFATEKAKQTHFEALQDEAARHCPGLDVCVVDIKNGQSREELKENFRLISRTMSKYSGNVAFDITHGFRSSSFLASAVISHLNHVRAAKVLADPNASHADFVEVYYAAFDAKEEVDGINKVPVWDLTWLIELSDWSAAINQLLATGHGGSLATLVDALARRKKKRLAQAGQIEKSQGLDRFSKAVEAFSRDLDAVRVRDLIFDNPAQSKHWLPSACDLARKVREHKELIDAEMPELSGALEQLEKMLAPFAEPVTDFTGQDVEGMKQLARLYLQFKRYPEALIVMREAITSYFSPPEARQPGDGFDTEVREAVDRAITERKDGQWSEFLKVRNDVMHAGMNKQPEGGEVIAERTDEHVRQMDKLIEEIKAYCSQ